MQNNVVQEAVQQYNELFKVEAKAKHVVNDSVFKDLFSDPDNVRKLYLKLHPEDADVEVSDITANTLKSIFIESLINDLSFLVRDTLMIMVEAQTKWNYNIVFRLLEYAVQSLHNYIKLTEQDVHAQKLVHIPNVELYVLYTGEDNKTYDVLTIKELFYGGQSCSIDASVKVLYGDDGNDIVCQYADFVKVLRNCCKELGRTQAAVKKAIEICKDKGTLKEYLEKRETEVMTIMQSLFDQEYALMVHDKAREKEIRAEEQQKADARVAEEQQKADARVAEAKLKSIRNLMKNMGCEAVKAMETLGIDAEEQKELLKLI